MKSPPSVCAFVSNLSSEATDCRPVTFAHEWIMTIARRGLKVKVISQGQGHGTGTRYDLDWGQIFLVQN